MGINLGVYNIKSSKCESSKYKCQAAQHDACVGPGTKYIGKWYWYELIACMFATENICHLLMSTIKALCDVDAESCRWWCHWVMLAMVLPRWLNHGVMSLSSHASDGTAVAIWLWHDIVIKSYWWWRCWGGLAMARCHCWVMLATVLPSHTGDGTAGATRPRRDVAAESCWWWCYRVMLVMALSRRLGHSMTRVVTCDWCRDLRLKPWCATRVRIYGRSQDVPAL
jgi:hypothetical protein